MGISGCFISACTVINQNPLAYSDFTGKNIDVVIKDIGLPDETIHQGESHLYVYVDENPQFAPPPAPTFYQPSVPMGGFFNNYPESVCVSVFDVRANIVQGVVQKGQCY